MYKNYIFIGIDCAYRSLGWSIMAFKPDAAFNDGKSDSIRDMIQYLDGGVEDVLNGRLINDVSDMNRARALRTLFTKIANKAQLQAYNFGVPDEEGQGMEAAKIIIVIEHQPRHGVHDTNQIIEAQAVYHFTNIDNMHVESVYLINPSFKNKLACRLLDEAKVRTYSDRKAQSRRAFEKISTIFNFDARIKQIQVSKAPKVPKAPKKTASVDTPIAEKQITYKNTPDDLADACMQIIAAIFICHKHIDV